MQQTRRALFIEIPDSRAVEKKYRNRREKRAAANPESSSGKTVDCNEPAAVKLKEARYDHQGITNVAVSRKNISSPHAHPAA